MTMMQGLLPPALKLQKIEFYVIVSWVYLDYDTLFERPTSISCNFENILSNRVWKYHVTGDSVIVNNIDRPKLNLTGDMREFVP